MRTRKKTAHNTIGHSRTRLAIEESINIPLYFIRLKLSTLDRSVPYVVYCDTGRRSSAAAFIMVERGFDAFVLKGGLTTGNVSLRRSG